MRGRGLLLTAGTISVHALTRDAVALGHLFGGLQHVPVDLGLVLGQPAVGQHVGVHFLLHAGDAFNTTGHVNVGLAGDDPLRGQRNGLQARRAKAVDRHARHRHRAAGAQRDLAGDVGAGGAFGRGATHDDVIDFAGLNAGTGHGMLNGMAAQRGAVRHVEGALPAFGQRGAGSRNNHS